MKKYSIHNKLLKGGWILENNKSKCIITEKPIINRLTQEIKNYEQYNFKLVKNNLYSVKKENFKLKFKIIISHCVQIQNIGSLIRSTVRLLVNFNPNDLLFILDLRNCINFIKDLKKNITALISTSTTAITFTNVFLLLNKDLYDKDYYQQIIDNNKNTCISNKCNLFFY